MLVAFCGKPHALHLVDDEDGVRPYLTICGAGLPNEVKLRTINYLIGGHYINPIKRSAANSNEATIFCLYCLNILAERADEDLYLGIDLPGWSLEEQAKHKMGGD